MGMGLNLRMGLGAASGGAFDPASLFANGEQGFIYDPSDPANVFQDSAGTVAGVDGQPVGYLVDLSGNGKHAVQATSASRPTLTSGALVLAGDDYLIPPTGMLSGWTSGTAVYASKVLQDAPTAGAGPVLGDFGSSGSSEHYPFNDGVVYMGFLSAARKTCGDAGAMDSWHVADFRSAASNFRAAYNGTEYYTTGTNTVGVGANPLIGKSASFFHRGSVGRIILINRVLTADELTASRAWAGAPYGVSL